jgi:hypothetical protein
MGQMNEKVYLPDGLTLTTKRKILLPFEQLSTRAANGRMKGTLQLSIQVTMESQSTDQAHYHQWSSANPLFYEDTNHVEQNCGRRH